MLEMNLITAGRISYLEGLELQRKVLEKLKSGADADTLIIMEHHPVITAGRKARLADIHIPRCDRLFRGIELHFTERGGGLTYHGYGQIVGYPVMRLSRMKLNVTTLMERLATTVIMTMSHFGVDGIYDRERPGVYIGGKKVASIGLRISGDISSHGFSFNISGDPSPFRLFVPCNMEGLEAVTLEEAAGRRLSIAEVQPIFLRFFAECFNVKFVTVHLNLGLSNTKT